MPMRLLVPRRNAADASSLSFHAAFIETDGWSPCYEIRPIGRGRPWGTGWRGLLFTRDANVRLKAFRGRSLGNFARTGATAGQTDLKRLAPLHYRASLAICSRTKRLVEPSGFWDAQHEVQVLNRCA